MRTALALVSIPFALIGCQWVASIDEKYASASAAGSGGATSPSTTAASGGSAGSEPGVSGAGGGGAGGASTGCLAMCNGVCTDTLRDEQHCGSCNVACAAGVACDLGICGRSLSRGPGAETLCASKPDGKLYCWGVNSAAQAFIGEAGDPLVEPTLSILSTPIRYAAGTGFASCALSAAGAVQCVGAGAQVGNGTQGGGDVSCIDPAGCVGTPYSTIASGIVEIAGAGLWTGGTHFCARTEAGDVSCWGDVDGCTVVVPATTPKPVDGLTGVVQMAAGADFNCALRYDGTVWCWGANCHGTLGQGDFAPHVGPVQVKGLVGVTTIGTGTAHACARAAEGVYCWGSNATAQLGAGITDEDVYKPVPVLAPPGLVDVVQIAGSVDATCALTSAGDVYCWGRGDFGFMGDGNLYTDTCPNGGNACALAPKKANLAGVVEIALGYETGIARVGSGALFGWGADEYGELGNGKTDSAPYTVPVLVHDFP